MGPSNYVYIEVQKISRETAKAFLVVIEDKQIWLPRSQIGDADEYHAGDLNCTMAISEFVARREGLKGE